MDLRSLVAGVTCPLRFAPRCLIKMADISIEEARLRMIQKRFGGNAAGANVGGMRKNKGTHKSVGGEHKRVGGLA